LKRTPAIGVTNTYLVVGSEGAIWMDTGWDREGEAQAKLESEGHVSASGERVPCLNPS